MLLFRVLDKFCRIVGASVIALSASAPFVRPIHSHQIEATAAIRAGYDRAVRCYGAAPVPLEKIQLNLVKGNGFHFWPIFTTQELLGVTLFNHRVYVAEDYQDDVTIWAHEFVHALGVIGHPPGLFERCRLYTLGH